MRYGLSVLIIWLSFTAAGTWGGETDTNPEFTLPDFMAAKGMSWQSNPLELADSFLGIPYRDDGTMDHLGRFTLFETQNKFFPSPGLNCSGLVLSLTRYLLHTNFTIDQARRDRLDDSGPSSPQGRSWDFGWDLVMNLTDSGPRKIILPDGPADLGPSATAENCRGFDLLDDQAWSKVLRHIRPGYLYLASFSRQDAGKTKRILHYHVAVILADEYGHVNMYQTTHQSGSVRMDMINSKVLQRFFSAFGPIGTKNKMILVVETPLPDFGRPFLP